MISRQLANTFLEPDLSAPAPPTRARLLATWELLGPLLRAFERASGGAPSCMALPQPSSLRAPAGRELMPHQARLVASAAEGHRTFLLADEPGLGKTAQALLAAEAAEEAERAKGDARLDAARAQVLEAVSHDRGPKIRTVSAAKLKPAKFLRKAKKSKDAFYVQASPGDQPAGADKEAIADEVARAFDEAD